MLSVLFVVFSFHPWAETNSLHWFASTSPARVDVGFAGRGHFSHSHGTSVGDVCGLSGPQLSDLTALVSESSSMPWPPASSLVTSLTTVRPRPRLVQFR